LFIFFFSPSSIFITQKYTRYIFTSKSSYLITTVPVKELRSLPNSKVRDAGRGCNESSREKKGDVVVMRPGWWCMRTYDGGEEVADGVWFRRGGCSGCGIVVAAKREK
jgi:hypothetical protein